MTELNKTTKETCPPEWPCLQLDILMALEADELNTIWIDRIAPHPPRLEDRALYARLLAYELQSTLLGALSSKAQGRLSRIAQKAKHRGSYAPRNFRTFEPGTVILKDWEGSTLQVVTTRDGFMFKGSVYPNLSRVATEITGCSTPGTTFFGVRAQR